MCFTEKYKVIILFGFLSAEINHVPKSFLPVMNIFLVQISYY